MSDHRPLIEALLRKHGLDPWILEIVDDVAARSSALGYPDGNPFRMAKSIATPSGAHHILLRSEITDGEIDSVKSSMGYSGFKREVASLWSEADFLTHVVLHEIAVLVLKTDRQEPRDRWAFTQMQIP